MNVNWAGAWVAGESVIDTSLYDRVEIVRGATGLMTGAGNPSASVNLVRKHADSSERKTALEAGVGRYLIFPYELGAGVIASLLGGGFFLLLLRQARPIN